MRKVLLIFLILPVFMLTACDESLYVYEDSSVFFDGIRTIQIPLSESPIQPILKILELPPEINSRNEWPADVLPEEFPVMDFTSITNVSAVFDPAYGYEDDSSIYPIAYPVFINGTATPEQISSFKQDLKTNGFENITLGNDENFEMHNFVNNEILIHDKTCMTREKSFNEATGLYTVELCFIWFVKYYDPTGGRGWPDYDTDLGLEEIVFDEWPRDYLPEGFPEPVAVDIVTMEQKKNGLFITFYESFNTLSLFLEQLNKSGYIRVGSSGGLNDLSPNRYKDPMFNSDYDRYTVYYELTDVPGFSSEDINGSLAKAKEYDYKEQHITFQIIKGEDTIRYWEALGKE